jgi:hypothetical protein
MKGDGLARFYDFSKETFAMGRMMNSTQERPQVPISPVTQPL